MISELIHLIKLALAFGKLILIFEVPVCFRLCGLERRLLALDELDSIGLL